MPQNTAGRGLVVGQHMIGILLAFLPHATNVQWRGLKEFQRRAGHVSARISPSIATNQGIYVSRSP